MDSRAFGASTQSKRLHVNRVIPRFVRVQCEAFLPSTGYHFFSVSQEMAPHKIIKGT